MQAQSEAILEVGFGVVTGSMDDGGFFGPTGFLGKRADKGQNSIKSLLVSARRMKFDEETSKRLPEFETDADSIVDAGFQMVPLLEAGKTEEATRLYSEQSLPAQVEATGAAYTMGSTLEREAKMAALRCR